MAVKKSWYALKCRPDREGNVRRAFRRQTRIHFLDYLLGKILDPKTKTTEVRNGKKEVVRERKYDGYLIVQLHWCPDMHHLLKTIADVSGLVGTEDEQGFINPTPIKEEEVRRLLQDEREYKEKPTEVRLSYFIGDRVRVKNGAFKGKEGVVKRISGFNEPKVIIECEVLGRTADVETRYWQIEKA